MNVVAVVSPSYVQSTSFRQKLHFILQSETQCFVEEKKLKCNRNPRKKLELLHLHGMDLSGNIRRETLDAPRHLVLSLNNVISEIILLVYVQFAR